DRGADAGDVADADGAGHGGGDRLEGGEGALFAFGRAFEEAAETFVPSKAEVGKLKEVEADRQVNAGGGEKNHERRPPDDAIRSDRGADAGDVADADGAGHGGGDRLEGGEGALFAFGRAFEEAAETFVPSKAEVGKLKEVEADRQVNAGGGEKNHERRPPDDAI